MAVKGVLSAILVLLAVSGSLAENYEFAGQFSSVSSSWGAVPANNEMNYNNYFASTNLRVNSVDLLVQYTPLFQSATYYPGFDGKPFPFGSMYDVNGQMITPVDGAAFDWQLQADFDRTSIFEKFGKIWAITQLEVTAGQAYLSELSQDPVTGVLKVVRMKNFLDSASVRGYTRPCSGSLTPWKTHLLSEESLSNARDYPNLKLTLGVNGRTASYSYGVQTAQAVAQRMPWQNTNPYWNGWHAELDVVNADGDTSAVKRYSMGRAGWELALVMPDNKTVYMNDDESGAGIHLMFIADIPGDLRSGKLYGAKWVQVSAANGGSANMQWIHLNPDGKSVHEDTIRARLEGPNFNSTIKFSDLFDFLEPTWSQGTATPDAPPAGYRAVLTESSRFYEWLRLKPGMGALASRLEPRRMASYVGATVEFSKWEGLALDIARKELYIGCTAIRGGMLDNPGGRGGYDISANHIKLPSQPAGAVYKMKLSARSSYNSSWVGTFIYAVVNSFGHKITAGVESVPENSIASPDNIAYSPRYDTLFISEDCDEQHINNAFWAYNVRTRTLKRIATAPRDGEITSGYYYTNIKDFSYLTATLQHPNLKYNNGTVGYWVLPKEV